MLYKFDATLNKRSRQLLKVNHFDKVKGRDISKFNPVYLNDYYFDTETFELYNSPEQSLPIIIAYHIGLYDKTSQTYTTYFGADATDEFLEDLFTKRKLNNSRISAFNLDYDFQTIRPHLERNWLDKLDIDYTMDDSKKFLFGELKLKTKSERGRNRPIKLNDLWLWNRSQSLRSYIQYIQKLIWDKDGNIYDTETARELKTSLDSVVLDRTSFNKLSIDYQKVNLHRRGSDWYYWRSKDDWVNGLEPTKLDIDLERQYLEIDVKSLVVVHKEIDMFKKTIQSVLGIEKPKDGDLSITLPGYGKYIFEEYITEFMQQSYRKATDVRDYEEQELSYTGAFTASNTNFTYLDEEVFKQHYPNQSFYDLNNKPIIKSYDINSLYPSVMVTGLPVGKAYAIEDPSVLGDYTTWYEITFTRMWDDENWYVWKPKYSYLNNCFFGNNFLFSFQKGMTQKYVWKPLFDKFMEMCDSYVEVVEIRHQKVSHKMTEFINLLYEVKKNNQHIDSSTGKPKIDADGNPMQPRYNGAQREAVKLLLNSLYGKLGERFKRNTCKWHTSISKKIEKLEKKEEVTVKKTRRTLTPYINEELDCGFLISQNKKKTKNTAGDAVRESILAGLYVTQRSRWILMTAIKDEIDQGNVVLNCDTDSLKLIQFSPPKFTVDDYELGAWKNEGTFTHFGHPNKLKKYWLGNKHEGKIKIACGGVPEKAIYDKNDGESYEEVVNKLKVIYDVGNVVEVKDCKPVSKRNSSWQIVIDRTDYVFRRDSEDQPVTHYVVDRKVILNNG